MHGKFGNEFEREYVASLFLRVLANDLASVTWEERGERERGVDVWFHEDGHDVAVQAKKREFESWSPSTLKKEKVLENALAQLAAPAGASRFLFLTTVGGGRLQSLLAKLREPSPFVSLEDRDLLAKAGLGKLVGDDNAIVEFANAFEFRVMDRKTLSEELGFRCRLMAPNDPQRLRDALMGLKIEAATRISIDSERLLALLGDSSSVLADFQIDDHALWLRNSSQQFVADLARQPSIEPRIERSVADDAIEAIAAASAPQTLLLHGAPGSGKSFVLADVIGGLRDAGRQCLAIRADQCHELLDRQRALMKLSARPFERRPIWVIDQLDQLSTVDPSQPELVQQAEQVYRLARKLQVTLLVGCRSVDALQDTRLRFILEGRGQSDRSRVKRLEVGALTESEVTAVLTRLGIPWSTLPLRTRGLISNPFCLHLFSLRQVQSALVGAGAPLEVALAWLNYLCSREQRALLVLDELLERMDETGRLSVNRVLLASATHQEIESLVLLGLLARDERGDIRAAHQLPLDARRAQKIGKVSGPDAARQLLGSRRSQSLRTARSVRDAAQILGCRGAMGAAILDSIQRSNGVRSIVKQAMQLGLAGISEPDRELVDAVIGWLDLPEYSRAVRVNLLWSNVRWVRAVEAWIETLWSRGSRAEQDEILRVLGSISEQDGDFVAKRLVRWQASAGDVLARARTAFAHDPTLDTDELFKLRMSAPPESASPFGSHDWNRLMSFAPDRAAKLLKREILSAPADDWLNDEFGERRLPELDDWKCLEPSDVPQFWQCLAPGWEHVGSIDVERASISFDMDTETGMRALTSGLGCALAAALDAETLSIEDLLRSLPNERRDLDRWLLLRVGLGASSSWGAGLGDFVSWLITDQRVLELGFDLDLRATVESVARVAGRDDLLRLEEWAMGARSSWTTDQEIARWSLANVEGGRLLPNSVGHWPYLLLSSLPEEQLSLRARGNLESLERKYKGETSIGPRSTRGMRPVSYFIPAEATGKWNEQEWVARLREPLRQSETARWERSDEAFMDDSIRSLISRLSFHAGEEPRRFLAVLAALARDPLGIPHEAFSHLLSAILMARRAKGNATELWWEEEAAAEIASVVAQPAILEAKTSAREVAQAVLAFSHYEWPFIVVERLAHIALGRQVAAMHECTQGRSMRQDLSTTQLNDARCLALEALERLAESQPEWREQTIHVASALVEDDAAALRAIAAAVAYRLTYDSEASEAVHLLSAACTVPEVAASYQCVQALWHAYHYVDAAMAAHSLVVDAMLRPLDSESAEIVSVGGEAAWALYRHGDLDAARLESILESSEAAREGVAKRLASAIGTPEWRKEDTTWLERLGNDPCDDVGDAVVLRTLGRWRLEGSVPLSSILLRTRAGIRNSGRILDRIDKAGELGSMADAAIDAVMGLLSQAQSGLTSTQLWHEYPAHVDRLLRLVADCDAKGKLEQRAAALDVLDQLVDRLGLPAFGQIRGELA